MRVSALFFDKDARYPCVISPCKVWDDALAEAVSGPELKVYCYWESKKVSTLLSLHISSAGQVPDLRLLPVDRARDASGFDRFAEEHQHCLENRKAIVIKVNEARELLLVPVISILDDGTRWPVFWGYMLYFGVASAVSLMLDNSRMAVILDLDETLLVANSMSTLDSKIEVARKTRRLKASELKDLTSSGVTADSEEAARLRGAEASAAKEEELLAADLDLLRQFATTGAVTVNGVTHKARAELAYLEDGSTIKRPVIRLEKPQPLILTRIRPEQRETSMILRPRPNWEELRGVLAGDQELGPDGKPKLRFEVYVCTAAERQYALEVWRLLDTRGNIIPVEQRTRRIINVAGGRKKQLLKSLGVAETAGAPRLEWPEMQDEEPPVPLAVILDDRLDVWEAAAQPCILQVVPWYWYRDEAARLVSGPGTPADRLAIASENEVRRMRDAVMQLRAELFFDINERLRSLADDLIQAGAPEAKQQEDPAQLLPGLKTVAGVLRSASSRVYQMPTLASIAAQYRLTSSTPPPDAINPAGPTPPLAPAPGGQPPSTTPPAPLGPASGPLGPVGGPPLGVPPIAAAGPFGVEGPLANGGAGANPGAAAPAPAPPISLKPVDPRAARRAAAAAGQRSNGVRPPTVATASGAAAGLGPPGPAPSYPGAQPPPAPEPPKRRFNAPLDASMWSIEALDGGPQPAPKAAAAAPIDPRATAGVAAPAQAAGAAVAPLQPQPPHGPAATRPQPGPVSVAVQPCEGPTRPASPAVVPEGGSSTAGLRAAAGAAAAPRSAAPEERGPGGGSMPGPPASAAYGGPPAPQQQQPLPPRAAHQPEGLPAGAPPLALENPAPGQSAPAPGPGQGPSGPVGEGGGGDGGGGSKLADNNLVARLISQISAFEPAVRAQIEVWLTEGPAGVPKVVALLQAQGQQQQQQPPQQVPQSQPPPTLQQPHPPPQQHPHPQQPQQLPEQRQPEPPARPLEAQPPQVKTELQPQQRPGPVPAQQAPAQHELRPQEAAPSLPQPQPQEVPLAPPHQQQQPRSPPPENLPATQRQGQPGGQQTLEAQREPQQQQAQQPHGHAQPPQGTHPAVPSNQPLPERTPTPPAQDQALSSGPRGAAAGSQGPPGEPPAPWPPGAAHGTGPGPAPAPAGVAAPNTLQVQLMLGPGNQLLLHPQPLQQREQPQQPWPGPPTQEPAPQEQQQQPGPAPQQQQPHVPSRQQQGPGPPQQQQPEAQQQQQQQQLSGPSMGQMPPPGPGPGPGPMQQQQQQAPAQGQMPAMPVGHGQMGQGPAQGHGRGQQGGQQMGHAGGQAPNGGGFMQQQRAQQPPQQQLQGQGQGGMMGGAPVGQQGMAQQQQQPTMQGPMQGGSGGGGMAGGGQGHGPGMAMAMGMGPGSGQGQGMALGPGPGGMVGPGPVAEMLMAEEFFLSNMAGVMDGMMQQMGGLGPVGFSGGPGGGPGMAGPGLGQQHMLAMMGGGGAHPQQQQQMQQQMQQMQQQQMQQHQQAQHQQHQQQGAGMQGMMGMPMGGMQGGGMGMPMLMMMGPQGLHGGAPMQLGGMQMPGFGGPVQLQPPQGGGPVPGMGMGMGMQPPMQPPMNLHGGAGMPMLQQGGPFGGGPMGMPMLQMQMPHGGAPGAGMQYPGGPQPQQQQQSQQQQQPQQQQQHLQQQQQQHVPSLQLQFLSGGPGPGMAGPQHAGMKRPPSPSVGGGAGEPPAKLQRQGAPADNVASAIQQAPWHAKRHNATTAAPPSQPHKHKGGAGGAPPPPGPPPGAPAANAGAEGGEAVVMLPVENAVTKLNEISQRNKVPLAFREMRGHAAGGGWTSIVSYGGKDIGRGTDKTKKEAKRLAATDALRSMGVTIATAPAPAGQPGSSQLGGAGANQPAAARPSIGTALQQPAGPAAAPAAAAAAAAAGNGTCVFDAAAAAGDPVHPNDTDVSLHRLHAHFGKERCVFEVVRDEGTAPNRIVECELRILNTPHRVVGTGSNRGNARWDASARLLTLLRVPLEQPDAAAGPAADAAGAGSATASRPHHPSQQQQQPRQASRSPSHEEQEHEDEDEAGDEDYDMLAGSAYFGQRGGRASGQSANRGAMADDQGAAQAYAADLMAQIAEELDDVPGGGGGGAGGYGGGSGTGGGKGRAAPRQQPQRGRAEHESSEEEEGELPSE